MNLAQSLYRELCLFCPGVDLIFHVQLARTLGLALFTQLLPSTGAEAGPSRFHAPGETGFRIRTVGLYRKVIPTMAAFQMQTKGYFLACPNSPGTLFQYKMSLKGEVDSNTR